jgi:hypothetical protein
VNRKPSVAEYREMLARKHAAAMGISIAELQANVAREQAKLDRVYALRADRFLAWGTIALFAARNGRAFVRGAA